MSLLRGLYPTGELHPIRGITQELYSYPLPTIKVNISGSETSGHMDLARRSRDGSICLYLLLNDFSVTEISFRCFKYRLVGEQKPKIKI